MPNHHPKVDSAGGTSVRLPRRDSLVHCPSWPPLSGPWRIRTFRGLQRFLPVQDYGSYGKIVSLNAFEILLLLVIPRARDY